LRFEARRVETSSTTFAGASARAARAAAVEAVELAVESDGGGGSFGLVLGFLPQR
jgi:hypothetical protein